MRPRRDADVRDMDSTAHPVRPSVGGVLVGAAEQLLNELMARLRIPIDPLPDVPPGDIFEPVGASRRAGADAVERLIRGLSGRHDVDPQAARDGRPLLASATVQCTGGGATTHVSFDADAPGADWSKPGCECGMVAVYVDGRYLSNVVVLHERTGGYEVNLGALAAGSHEVELRAATELAPIAPRVGELRSRELTGEAALVDRLAPILEMRDTDRSGRSSIAHSDTPLVLMPSIQRNADGTRTIEYRVIFSNEDGGTALPLLYAKFGRGVDVEPVYRVHVDAAGHVLDETYQAPIHKWFAFDGERVDGRPVLRVSTANNMVSARTDSGHTADRWSDASVGVVDAGASEFTTMAANAWTWAIMAKELLREHKAEAAGAARTHHQIADPRGYVYLGPIGDAQRAAIAVAGGLELVLQDGRHVFAKVAEGFAQGDYHQAALELPEGAVADAVAGVALLGIQALVLTSTFGIRQLAHAA
jgi:hypothetical protein